MPGDGERAARLADRAGWLAPLLALPLLVAAALANPGRFNPDAVAYLQLALHWREGAWDLAASAYWGPLFPWLAALAMGVVADPIAAGRVVMAGSALGFIAAGGALLRALEAPAPARIAGMLCLLVFAVAWSVQIMTPDLLVTALLMAGLAAALSPRFAEGAARPVLAGLCFALGFHAKAVALPLGVALLLAAGLWHLATGDRRAIRATAIAGVVLALVAAPWIAVVSMQQGAPSMGTAGSINLAIAGPHYVGAAGDRFDPSHPAFTSFHIPREGRITAWEEATEMAYVRWSPLADPGHLLRLVRYNLALTFATLRGFDLFGIGLAAVLIAPFAAFAGARPWRFALVPAALAAGIYLPVLSNAEARYLMLCLPLFLAAAGGLLCGARGWLGWVGAAVLAFAFILPMRHELAVALGGRDNPAFVAARQLAADPDVRLAPGGVASVGELGFAAIFTAFLVQRPFMGTEDALPESERLRGIGLLLVAENGAADAALAARGAQRVAAARGIAAWRLP
jgi:hypothetical protein